MAEVGELHLGHGRMPFTAAPMASARDKRLGQRGVDHAVGAELLEEAVSHAEHTAARAHVLAEDEHALVALHLLAQAVADCLD